MTDLIVTIGLAPWVVLFALLAVVVLLLAALVLAPLWAPIAAAISQALDRWRKRDHIDTTPK